MSENSRIIRMPEELVKEVDNLSDKLDLPRTKTLKVKEKFFMGDFKARKKKRKGRGKKTVFELEFDNL